MYMSLAGFGFGLVSCDDHVLAIEDEDMTDQCSDSRALREVFPGHARCPIWQVNILEFGLVNMFLVIENGGCVE